MEAHLVYSEEPLKNVRQPIVAEQLPEFFPLKKKQRRLRPWLPGINAICNFSAAALGRRKLVGRENAQRGLEHFLDPLCRETGIWPDFMEGESPPVKASFNEAMAMQFDFFLDQTGCGAGTKVLDIGCGSGRLLMIAQGRGCDAVGITASRAQQTVCAIRGLNVKQASLAQAKSIFEPGQFDVVIVGGSMAHSVTEEDAMRGQKEENQAGLFAQMDYLLKEGGRVFIAANHFNRTPEPRKAMEHPLRHQAGSYHFFWGILAGLNSCWYPDLGDLEKAASRVGFHKVFEKDATEDRHHSERLRASMMRSFFRENRSARNRFLAGLFFKDPRFFFRVFLLWQFEAWTWQFRLVDGPDGLVTPMRHLWQMFEK